MSAETAKSEDIREWTESELVEKLGGGPHALASTSNWPKSLAFLRHMKTVDNFQHAVWGLAENNNIEDREVCGAIQSYLSYIPNGMSNWVKQLESDHLTLHKFSPLAKLVSGHHHFAARILIKHGMNPDFPCDAEGRTAIQGIVFWGTFEVDGLRLLLEHGGSPHGDRDEHLCMSNAPRCRERPVLCVWKKYPGSDPKSAHTKEQSFVELITYGARINELDSAGNNIAHVICTVGSSTAVIDLIAMKGIEAKRLLTASRTTDGHFPIHIACNFGHAQLISTLIAHGIIPNTCIDVSKLKHQAYSCSELGTTTCFYLTLVNGKSYSAAMNVLKLLDGETVAASVNRASETTPLHWCVWNPLKFMKDNNEHSNIIKALIKSKCSVESRDRAGRLPIHLACSGGHHSIVHLLAPTEKIINSTLNGNARGQFLAAVDVLRLQAQANLMNVSTATFKHDGHYARDESENTAVSSKTDESDNLDMLPSGKVIGMTPLLLAIMSRDIECVQSVLSVSGILKFQMSSEPTETIYTSFPPVSPFALHYPNDLCADRKVTLAKEVLSRFQFGDKSSVTRATIRNDIHSSIHSPLSYAMITGQFDVVEVILKAMSENESIAYSELIMSKFRSKEDLFLLLISTVIKTANLHEMPEHFQSLLPNLAELIECQLESVPYMHAQHEEKETRCCNNDEYINQIIAGITNIKELPATSEGMPKLVGCNNINKHNVLSCIHMVCILGYPMSCESLIQIIPSHNYSLHLQTGNISPLHVCLIYKQSTCLEILLKYSSPESLHASIQEPLLNHMLPIHVALLSGNLEVLKCIYSVLNSFKTSNCGFITDHPAFAFQILATAGSGYDVEMLRAKIGGAKFICIALNQNRVAPNLIYSNHFPSGFQECPPSTCLDALERANKSIFQKLRNNYVDCAVLCSLYGLTSHCQYLLSKCVSSTNKNDRGDFVDSLGSWVTMQASLMHDWSRTIESGAWTPVNVAIHRGHRKILELLLSHGHDCNTRSPLGWTPLTLACFKSETSLVDLLLEHSAIVSRSDEAGWTPVMVCVTKLGMKRIRYSAEVTGEWSVDGTRDRMAKTLHKCPTRNSEDEFNRSSNAEVKFEAEESSPTSKSSNLLIFNSLIEKCDVSAEFSPDGWSALFTAICFQQFSIVKMLVAAKADVNKGCVDGRQPLFAACCIPHVPLVLYLLKLGAHPNPNVPHSRTKLMLQSIDKKEGIGQYLPQYQCLPIVAACKMGSMSIIIALLAACHSASLILDFETVRAAASACIESISMHILGMLLVHPVTRIHAAVTTAQSFHQSCLLSLMFWAADTCQLWAIRAALAFGGEVNGTKNGTSPLHIACSRSRSYNISIFLVQQVRT
jgi:ankyrin repeat protein